MYSGNIIIIGSSTGGPKVLHSIFSSLPQLNAAIIIVQHILSTVDKSFAERLNSKSSMEVKLSENGNLLEREKVYFAPASIHLKLVNNTKIELCNGEKVNFACPSVDVTMLSVVKHRAGKLVGVVLTGMGRDGADGISHIKNLGGITIAQDKKSSAIYSMPMEAYKTGNVDYVLSMEEIGQKLIELVGAV